MKGGPQTWDDFEEKSVRRACISPDGTRIAAVFDDKTICIYDTTTGEAIHPPFEVDENSWSVIFSRDGKLVASGGEVLRLWNVQTGEEVESFDIRVYSLAFSPDGTCIAAGCKRRDIDEKDSDGRGSYNIRVINLELAKASYFHDHLFIPSGGEGIKLLKGEVPPSPFEGQDLVHYIAYSADGKQIASSSVCGVVQVWDVSTGKSRTFNAKFELEMQGLTCYDNPFPIAFSPDGTNLVLGTALFNLFTGSCDPSAFGHPLQVPNSIAFSADGRFLASAYEKSAVIRIWNTSTYEIIANLVGHTSSASANSVDFFPDGKHIMSASYDGTIRVWDVDSALLKEWKEMDDWQIYVNPRLSGPGYYGWIIDSEGEFIFFTPLPFRHVRNTLVIGKCMTIDFSNFVHGDKWVKCRKPLNSKLEETRGSARDGGDR